jgi:hypothetical protein
VDDLDHLLMVHHQTPEVQYQILQLVLYLHAQLHSPVLLGVV